MENQSQSLVNAHGITQLGNPVLRIRAEEVEIESIQSPETQEIIDRLIKAMKAAGGIGIAGPQIGVSKRIVILEFPSYFRVDFGQIPELPLTVLINPEITSRSSDIRRTFEGCLSVSAPNGGHYEGIVDRPEKVTVKAYDRFGKEFVLEGEKLLARSLQHEIDHLDGILYVDRVQRVRDLKIVYPNVDPNDAVFDHNPNVSRPMAKS